MRRTGLLAVIVAAVIVAGCATATLLPDGRVLLLNLVAKMYDPVTGRVANLPMPPTPRVYATATLLEDGRVLVVGGAADLGSGVDITGATGGSGTVLATAELFDPATGSYTPTGSMARPRAFHTATRLADGRVLVLGGGAPSAGPDGTGTTIEPDLVPPPEVYDPTTGTFGPAGGTTLIPLALATATLLQDGRVLVAGGQTAIATPEGASPDPDGPTGMPTGEAELFDPATGTFSATGPMRAARVWHTATALPDGRVLIVGGSSDPSVTETNAEDVAATSAEVFHPTTGEFEEVGPLLAPRMGHAAALLSDGRVLITGGLDLDPSTPESLERSAELFDPAAGTFMATGDMVRGHAFHVATTLQDGRVLVAGFGEDIVTGASSGAPVDPLASAETYDPATGIFTTLEVEPAVMPSAAPGG